MPSFSKVTNYHTSMFLYNSSSVTVHDMNIIAIIITNFIGVAVLLTMVRQNYAQKGTLKIIQGFCLYIDH